MFIQKRLLHNFIFPLPKIVIIFFPICFFYCPAFAFVLSITNFHTGTKYTCFPPAPCLPFPKSSFTPSFLATTPTPVAAVAGSIPHEQRKYAPPGWAESYSQTIPLYSGSSILPMLAPLSAECWTNSELYLWLHLSIYCMLNYKRKKWKSTHWFCSTSCLQKWKAETTDKK